MTNSSLVTALLLCFTSIVLSEFYTVDIQPGEDITLHGTNYTSLPTPIYWFLMTHRSNASCISSMLLYNDNVSFCDTFQAEEEKYEMTSNISHIFLTIKNVDVSDTGLYFCGDKNFDGNPVMVSAIYLNVQDPGPMLPVFISVILCCMLSFLIVVIVLLKKIKTAHRDEHNPQHGENLNSDVINYAALNFHPQRRYDRQQDSNVIYTAIRQTH